MNRKTFISMLVAFVAIGFAFIADSKEASAQPCPDFWIELNYIVPAPHPGPITVDANFAMFTFSKPFYNDGHYTFPYDPAWGPPTGATVNGVFVPLGAKVKVPDPNMPPGMCIEVEVRLDSNGCLQIKLQPQGC